MNETTENFFKVYDNWKPVDPPEVVFRLVYDEKTSKALDLTIHETDLTHIIITRNEANQYPHLDPRAYVVDGKLEWKIKKINTNEQPNTLLVSASDNGDIVTDYNMLIIDNNGNQRWTHE